MDNSNPTTPKLPSFPTPPTNPISNNPPLPPQNPTTPKPSFPPPQPPPLPNTPPPLPPIPPIKPNESTNKPNSFIPPLPPVKDVTSTNNSFSQNDKPKFNFPTFSPKTDEPLPQISENEEDNFYLSTDTPTDKLSNPPSATPTYPIPKDDFLDDYQPDNNQPETSQNIDNPSIPPADYFTDPVVPEIQNDWNPSPQTPPSFDTTTPINTAPETPTPSFTPPILPPPPVTPPAPTPATLPSNSSSSSSKIFTFILIILVIGAIAAGAAFFIQYQKNKTTLNNAESTKERQQLEVTPTEEPSPAVETRENPNNYPQITTIPENVPTSSPVLKQLSNVFDNLEEVFALALKKSESAQLILITGSNVNSPEKRVYKYFFRSSLTQKTYFYIETQDGQNPTLVDNNISVTPDNNIPSINDDFKNKKLGIDLADSIALAQTEVINNTNFKDQIAEINAKYIKTKIGANITPMWELTFKYPNHNTPLVIQIDSLKNSIIFTNIKYTRPTTTPTPSPTSSKS